MFISGSPLFQADSRASKTPVCPLSPQKSEAVHWPQFYKQSLLSQSSTVNFGVFVSLVVLLWTRKSATEGKQNEKLKNLQRFQSTPKENPTSFSWSEISMFTVIQEYNGLKVGRFKKLPHLTLRGETYSFSMV